MTNFYEEARAIAREYIDPYAKAIDEEMRFPVELFDALKKTDLLKLIIPQEQGGLGCGLIEHEEICRAFAQSCASAGLCYMMHNVALFSILGNGPEVMKQEVVRDIMENGEFTALAFSEFGTGTNFFVSTLDVKDMGDKVVINGRKSMVTSATYAKYYLILAPSITGEGIDCYLLHRDDPGLSFEMNEWNGMGMRGNVSCPMTMKDLVLDKSTRMLGKPGDGMDIVFNFVALMFVTGLAGVYAGLCQHTLEVITNWSQSRKFPDGRALCNLETVQIHLGEAYTLTNAAVAAAKEAGRAGDAGEEDALRKILAGRIMAARSAIRVTNLAMQIGGGKIYNKKTCVEQLLRDAYAGQIMAPSVDVLILWLARAMTGQDLV